MRIASAGAARRKPRRKNRCRRPRWGSLADPKDFRSPQHLRARVELEPALSPEIAIRNAATDTRTATQMDLCVSLDQFLRGVTTFWPGENYLPRRIAKSDSKAAAAAVSESKRILTMGLYRVSPSILPKMTGREWRSFKFAGRDSSKSSVLVKRKAHPASVPHPPSTTCSGLDVDVAEMVVGLLVGVPPSPLSIRSCASCTCLFNTAAVESNLFSTCFGFAYVGCQCRCAPCLVCSLLLVDAPVEHERHE